MRVSTRASASQMPPYRRLYPQYLLLVSSFLTLSDSGELNEKSLIIIFSPEGRLDPPDLTLRLPPPDRLPPLTGLAELHTPQLEPQRLFPQASPPEGPTWKGLLLDTRPKVRRYVRKRKLPQT